MEDFNKLISKAQRVYQENFPLTTNFERAIFFSWYCSIADCGFCFMSANPEKHSRTLAKRSLASMIAEAALTKALGWDQGFISGGIGAFEIPDFVEIIKNICLVAEQKLWLNTGPLSKFVLEKYLPYTQGVVGAIETTNKELHKKVCPSKPVEPYLRMFEHAESLGLKKAMTLIVGLGETKEDFDSFAELIRTYKLDKVHIYGLVPQKKTMLANKQPPTPEYQAWWIAKTRVEFPKLDVQAGIWTKRPEHVTLCLRAGANTLSKFSALSKFGSPEAKAIEQAAKRAGRKFKSSLTRMPGINAKKLVAGLNIDEGLKPKVFEKLQKYVEKLSRKPLNIELKQALA